MYDFSSSSATLELFNNIDFWDDYYESYLNGGLNDFFSLYTSYYVFNSIEFLIIGYFLFIGSIICVNLNKNQKKIPVASQLTFLNLILKTSSFFFFRKQNLVSQNFQIPALKIIKKK